MTQKKEIPVYLFAGKEVGANVLCFLIKQNYHVRFVSVSTDADVELISLCKENNLSFQVFSPSMLKQLLTDVYDTGWLINAWSPHFIPDTILAKFTHSINLHPSYIPYGKGSDSGTWAIREKSPVGVSLISIVSKLDEGDIFARKKIEIEFNMPGIQLATMLKKELVLLFQESWQGIYNNSVKLVSHYNDGPGTSHKKKETRADKVKKITDFENVEEFILWALAHHFGDGNLPVLIKDNTRYEINLTLLKTTD